MICDRAGNIKHVLFVPLRTLNLENARFKRYCVTKQTRRQKPNIQIRILYCLFSFHEKDAGWMCSEVNGFGLAETDVLHC
jgi:hypothetical protein